MKLSFKNGKTINYNQAFETEEYFNGSSRRTLTVECNTEEISVDELNSILSKEENLLDITMLNEELSVSNNHTGYVLKLKLGIEPKLISAESLEKPAQYMDVLTFKLGKRTYIEQQLKKLGIS